VKDWNYCWFYSPILTKARKDSVAATITPSELLRSPASYRSSSREVIMVEVLDANRPTD
jgi:hypothetical protein